MNTAYYSYRMSEYKSNLECYTALLQIMHYRVKGNHFHCIKKKAICTYIITGPCLSQITKQMGLLISQPLVGIWPITYI